MTEWLKDKLEIMGNIIFGFFVNVLKKIIETAVSVKVWMLFIVFFFSKDLLERGKITGDNFAAIIASLMSVVVVMRGVTKISWLITESRKYNSCNKCAGSNNNDSTIIPPPKAMDDTI